VALVGPDLTPVSADLSQVAPGVYESPVESLESGAYAVRVTQTKPGAAALGRTLGLVAPTAAEYRLLGPNQPLLGAIRAATGGKEAALPADAWIHDLRATSHHADLWPLLLVLALLLWPLDIALRRVSVGRRELAGARRWVSNAGRGRRVATRTATAESMLAATGRSSAARSAILREAASGSATPVSPATAPAAVATAGPSAQQAPSQASAVPPAPRQVAPGAPSPAAPPAASPTSQPTPPPASQPAASASDASSPDTLARLREAKRRTRG
jgi:Ca-activated chloride channel homolog